MVDPASFLDLRLPQEFIIAGLEFRDEPFVDAMGRRSVAMTRIVGREFRLTIQSGLDERE